MNRTRIVVVGGRTLRLTDEWRWQSDLQMYTWFTIKIEEV